MRIGVVGGRLAGSYASYLLSRMGHEVLLWDDSFEGEKPCGGGVTSKALHTMPWFRDSQLPHTEIHNLRMTSSEGPSGNLPLKNPIHIFSRATLDTALRDLSIRSGTRFIPERGTQFRLENGGWSITTREQTYEVEFLVGADGATSSVRNALLGKYRAEDTSLALGFYLPGLYHQNTIIAMFQERGFNGYLWSFPRVDHSSVGILRRLSDVNANELRRRVVQFISSHYPDAASDTKFYAARIPCLRRRTLVSQRVCGRNWALLGDAAGFADAITAEGIYYALRSAELLAASLREENPLAYERKWRADFGPDLVRAAEWHDRFYGGSFLFQAFTRRAIQLARRSLTVQRLTDSVICGARSYDELRKKLILMSPRILVEGLRYKSPRSNPS